MDISKRIEKVMKENSSSPAEFSEKTGIQRPALSHIFSGRNKPSLEMVTKILTKFPHVNAEWLITGKEPKEPFFPQKEEAKKVEIKKDNELGIPKIKSSDKEAGKKKKMGAEKIVIFYKDGTFREYTPS